MALQYFAGVHGERNCARALDILSRPEVVTFCACIYGWVPSWPTVRLVSKDAFCVLRLPWMWARHQPRGGIFMMNERCTFCGWWTGRLFLDEPQCTLCANTAICRGCVVDGVCLECMDVDEAPTDFKCFKMLEEECWESLDHLHKAGWFAPRSVLRRSSWVAWVRMVDEQKRRSRAGQMPLNPVCLP